VRIPSFDVSVVLYKKWRENSQVELGQTRLDSVAAVSRLLVLSEYLLLFLSKYFLLDITLD